MARVLAADDDVLARAMLVDALRGLGHEVLVAPDTEGALLLVERGQADAVVAAARPGPVDVFAIAANLARMESAPPLLIACDPRAELAARVRALPNVGVVGLPIHPDRLGAALEKALAAPEAPAPVELADPWSGPEALVALRGPLDRIPPARALFLAHRVGGTGLLVVEPSASDEVPPFAVGVRGGRVVYARGLPPLAHPSTPAHAAAADLSVAIAATVQQGAEASEVFAAASALLGDQLARLTGARSGEVRFDAAWTPPPGTFPLPDAVPAMIAAGLRRMRSPGGLSRTWDARTDAALRVQLPGDAPEARWGLDAPSLRMLREAGRGGSVGALVVRVAGSDSQRRVEALRALDLLHTLGLIALDGGVVAPGAAAAPTVERTQGTNEDPRHERMKAALARLETALPIDALELGERRRISEEDVATAFRDVSKRYHPDIYFNAPPAVRHVAEACFARVSTAYEALLAPGGLSEAKRVIEARLAGVAYVSEKDHQAARVAFRRAEIALRNRNYPNAHADFAEAARLDPVTWPHALQAAFAGYLAKALPADQAIAALDALAPTQPPRQAEIAVVAGQILKLSGKTDAAVARFRAALEKDPENRDAQRELRLHEKRAGDAAAPASGVAASVSGLLSGFLRRKG